MVMLYTKTFTTKKNHSLHSQGEVKFESPNHGFFFQEEECEIFFRCRKFTIPLNFFELDKDVQQKLRMR